MGIRSGSPCSELQDLQHTVCANPASDLGLKLEATVESIDPCKGLCCVEQHYLCRLRPYMAIPAILVLLPAQTTHLIIIDLQVCTC